MLDYEGWLDIPTTPAREQLFTSFVTPYAYDAVGVMNNIFATVLDSFVIILSM